MPYSPGIHRMMVMDHHRLLRRLGVADANGDLLAPLSSFLLQISFHVFKAYGISTCLDVGKGTIGQDP